jgi:methylglyoxal/glyoxal reductase
MNITDISGTVDLHNGVKMPYFSLGVFLTKEGKDVFNSVTCAIENGYRHIDTASMYQNEKGVGEAIKANTIPREQVFVTSKVWNSEQGFQSALKAFDESLKKLGFNYLDLYLIHWPVKGKSKETWKAIQKL